MSNGIIVILSGAKNPRILFVQPWATALRELLKVCRPLLSEQKQIPPLRYGMTDKRSMD